MQIRLYLLGAAGCLALACATRPASLPTAAPLSQAAPVPPAAGAREDRCRQAPAAPECFCSAPKQPATERQRGIGIMGPLSELSEQFRSAHAAARARMCARLQSSSVVIRYSLGTVEVHRNGQVLVPPTSIYTPYVHVLKAVAHAPFLASLVFDEPPGPLRQEHLAAAEREVAAARQLLSEAREPVVRLLAAAERERQLAILAQTQSFLTSLHKSEPPRARADFIKSIRPLIGANLRDAARATLGKLDETIKGARALSEKEDPRAWDSVTVVANASHQSRARELAVQYFERMLGETIGEGARHEKRLVVLESVNKAADQRGLLAAHYVDREHAEIFFGDPDRLQWDVLADGGSLLNELLKESPRGR